jgi:hypothetical protein
MRSVFRFEEHEERPLEAFIICGICEHRDIGCFEESATGFWGNSGDRTLVFYETVETL